jgi:hypothetical protein
VHEELLLLLLLLLLKGLSKLNDLLELRNELYHLLIGHLTLCDGQ